MGSRPYHSRKEKKEANRKQRKERWIGAKNLMRQYPDSAYDGEASFFCNHVYTEPGWCWVDFRFFHTKLKRYFAVAATTLEYNALNANEEKVSDELDVTHPLPTRAMIFGKIDKSGYGEITFSDEFNAAYNVREPIRQQRLLELNREAQMMRPTIDVKDYGDVAVGLWVSLDVPKIDEHVIRDFIKFYRSIGEPTTPDFKWIGEEVSVVPAKLEERYAKFRSDSEKASVG